MMKALALVLSLPLVACMVGDATSPPDDPGMNPGSGSGPGSGPGSDPGMGDPGISGHITTDTTWTGTTKVGGAVIIDPGVTVTAMAGAIVDFGQNGSLQIDGTLDLQGTAASKVTLEPAPMNASGHYGATSINGTVTATYAIIHGAETLIAANGSFTATDTRMYGAAGDFLVMNGGTINVMYSQIGVDPGTTDTTHCNGHFNAATKITLSHSNINGSPYGLMYYAAAGADLTFNNWYGNQTDVEPNATATGTADSGWFEKGAPAGTPGITYQNLSATKLIDAGPRG